MRVGVDGRSLVGPRRGIGHFVAGVLEALAAMPDVEVRVLQPRSRAVHGTAALLGRPRLDRRLGGVDVVWLPAPAPVAVSRDTPYVVTFHDLGFLERPGDLTAYERLWHRLARPAVLARRAVRVIAPTAATAARIDALLGVDATVVGDGPGDPGPSPAPEAVAALRDRFGPYVLYVGALEPRKALDLLVAAHRGVEPALVMVGDGRLAAQLTGPNVHLLGRVDRTEKAALYAGALAVVLPSWLEGYGYPPLEGYAHGTPAIVADIPALRETAGAGALFVPPGDTVALAAAMRELAGDEALRQRLAANGADALRPRTWEATAAGLLAVLREAAA
jgi:glycosyltransferase involved in cell wall biosynthesis